MINFQSNLSKIQIVTIFVFNARNFVDVQWDLLVLSSLNLNTFKLQTTTLTMTREMAKEIVAPLEKTLAKLFHVTRAPKIKIKIIGKPELSHD